MTGSTPTNDQDDVRNGRETCNEKQACEELETRWTLRDAIHKQRQVRHPWTLPLGQQCLCERADAKTSCPVSCAQELTWNHEYARLEGS